MAQRSKRKATAPRDRIYEWESRTFSNIYIGLLVLVVLSVICVVLVDASGPEGKLRRNLIFAIPLILLGISEFLRAWDNHTKENPDKKATFLFTLLGGLLTLFGILFAVFFYFMKL